MNFYPKDVTSAANRSSCTRATAQIISIVRS